MASYSNLFPVGGGGAEIARIQLVTLSGSSDSRVDTITAVDLTKTVVIRTGYSLPTAIQGTLLTDRYWKLTSSTTLTDTRLYTTSNDDTTEEYSVIEYASGVIVTPYEVTVSGASGTLNQAITEVGANAYINFRGISGNSGNAAQVMASARCKLTSSTNVEIKHDKLTTADLTIMFDVVDVTG